MKLIVRSMLAFAIVAVLFALPLQAQETAPSSSAAASAPQLTSAPNYEISGSARSGKTPLPGAGVTAANTLTGKKYAAVTNTDGKFSFSGIVRGRYVLRIEFMGFSLFTQELVLNPQNPSAKVDAELLLASRQTTTIDNSSAASITALPAVFRVWPWTAHSPLSPAVIPAWVQRERLALHRTTMIFQVCR